MSKGAWVADGKAVVFCMECDWKADNFSAEHDCPRRPENLEKVIAGLADALGLFLRPPMDPAELMHAKDKARAALRAAGRLQ